MEATVRRERQDISSLSFEIRCAFIASFDLALARRSV